MAPPARQEPAPAEALLLERVQALGLPDLLRVVLQAIEDAAERGAARGTRAELDRREQYREAQLLVERAAPIEDEQIKGPEAARILGITPGALWARLKRGDQRTQACIASGTGKGRRFSRVRVLELARAEKEAT